MRDADAELKAIDPWNETATDGAQRLLTAMALCGEPRLLSRFDREPSSAPWGKDDSVAQDQARPAPPKPPKASRCSAESHAKLYMKSASMLADSSSPESKQMAELHAYYALALDPKVALPAGSSAAAKALVDAMKSRKNALKWVVPGVRVGAVTTTDESGKTDLEEAAAALKPTVRLCYASGLRNNPNLQGNLAMRAVVDADGRLSDVKVSGSLPDAGVLACATEFATRSKLKAPSKAPTVVTIPFVFSPGDN